MRQHLVLDAAAQLQLALQPLLLHRELLVRLDALRHAVERAGQPPDLVVRADRHPHGEVAGGELPGALGQHRQVTRHAPRDGHDADRWPAQWPAGRASGSGEWRAASASRDSPSGRAIPKVRPLASFRFTTIQLSRFKTRVVPGSPDSCATPSDSSVAFCLLVGREEPPVLVEGERHLALVRPGQHEHRLEHTLGVHLRVDRADDLAVPLDWHIHAFQPHRRTTAAFARAVWSCASARRASSRAPTRSPSAVTAAPA